MNKLFCLIMMFFACKVCDAQFNLVLNPSFEQFDTCPYTAGQIRYASPWVSPQIGFTPDYFNACDTSLLHLTSVPDNYPGFQYARTGVAYALVATALFPPNPAGWNYREYIEAELTDTLIAGVDYCLRWYVSACDSCHYITNNMGMYFSDTAIFYPCPGCPSPLLFTPQFENSPSNNLNDRFGWTEISGTYTASGGEKFILIGNFHDTSSTITTYTGWSNSSSIFFDAAAYYIDDVLVTLCDSLTGINELRNDNKVTLSPNPFCNQLTITSKTNQYGEVTFYDITSRKIFNQSFTNSTSIITEQLAKGIYLYEVRNKNGVIKKGKIVKE